MYSPLLVCFCGRYSFHVLLLFPFSALNYFVGFYWCQLFFHSFIYLCLILLFLLFQVCCCGCYFSVLAGFYLPVICFFNILSMILCMWFRCVNLSLFLWYLCWFIIIIILCHFFWYVMIGGFWCFFSCFWFSYFAAVDIFAYVADIYGVSDPFAVTSGS